MRHETATTTNARGQKIFRQWWLPDGEPKAIIFVVHGLNEHSTRYTHFAAALVAAGYGVYTLDNAGHGHSEGKRMYIDSWTNWVDDVVAYVDEVCPQYPTIPHVMFGHSLGGSIAVEAVARDPSKFKCLALSGPNVGPVGVTFVEMTAINIFSRLWPGMPVAAIDITLVAKDKDVVEALRTDPLAVSGKLPAKYCRELLDFNRHAGSKETAEKMTMPVYITHGSDDKITLLTGSQSWLKQVPHENKELRVWDGYYHEVLNEEVKEQVMAEMIAWIDKTLAAQ